MAQDYPLPAQTNLTLLTQLSEAGWSMAELRYVQDVWKLAHRSTHAMVRANMKAFGAHLIGTASAVAWDSDDPHLAAAALLHSVYEMLPGKKRLFKSVVTADDVVSKVPAQTAGLVRAYRDFKWKEVVSEGKLSELPGDHHKVMHLRLANAYDEYCDLLSPVETAKQNTMPTPAILAKWSRAVNAPNLSDAFLQLPAENKSAQTISEIQQRTVSIAEVAEASFDG